MSEARVGFFDADLVLDTIRRSGVKEEHIKSVDLHDQELQRAVARAAIAEAVNKHWCRRGVQVTILTRNVFDEGIDKPRVAEWKVDLGDPQTLPRLALIHDSLRTVVAVGSYLDRFFKV